MKVIFVRDMPADLWQQVKIEAAKRGINMRELVIELLTEGLKKSKV
jgi:plasmid stability protein